MTNITLGREMVGGTTEVLADGVFIGSAQQAGGTWHYRPGHGPGIIVNASIQADTLEELLRLIASGKGGR